MDELGMQKLVVDTVNGVGGFALKMSHRFLVGVPDLLVKMPGRHHGVEWPAAILEAKQRDTMKDGSRAFDLEVTAPQKNYLRAAHKGGMPVGVASFMQERGKGIRGLHLCVYNYSDLLNNDWKGYGRDHKFLGDHVQREETICSLILQFLDYSLREEHNG